MASKIIIEVDGGVVQEVYCDDPNVTVVLVDWDTEGCSPDERGLITVHDDSGRERLARVIELPTATIESLARDTQEAAKSVE